MAVVMSLVALLAAMCVAKIVVLLVIVIQYKLIAMGSRLLDSNTNSMHMPPRRTFRMSTSRYSAACGPETQ